MPGGNEALEGRLVSIAASSPWFMPCLTAVRGLGLASWCIGAGAVRDLVWDSLHGVSAPSALADVDAAYFEPADAGAGRDEALRRQLAAALPGVPWEVTNQAGVHLWFEACFGHPVAALVSLEDAVASWPEYATAVGLTLDADGIIHVIAPHGLDDLFSMVVRRNPSRVSLETYRGRIREKRYAERWPKVTIIS